MTNRILTGIKPTGSPHLGNLAGAIAPAIALSRVPSNTCYYFLADYHALTGGAEPDTIRQATIEIAATWLALGLDPQSTHFYRQSDLPEVTELNWLLTCVTNKGMLNRAHAYKAARADVDESDKDSAIGMGLFSYPILMAADILLFQATHVPVGKDQVQHVEMARDIAGRFNRLFRTQLPLPKAVVTEQQAVLPGSDGRKMSKSYGNTIGIWLDEASLRKAVARIVTDSTPPAGRKSTDAHLYQIYSAFATDAEQTDMRQRLETGIAWSDVKQATFEVINRHLSPARERYQALTSTPQMIEETLARGADRLRPHARKLLQELRGAVGIRRLQSSKCNVPHPVT